MGNLLSICPCNSEDNSKYVKNEYDPIGGLNLGKPQYQEQISRGSADQLLDTHSSLPSNIIDIKIGKKDLIKKRFESPYEHYEVIKKLGKEKRYMMNSLKDYLENFNFQNSNQTL